MPKPIGDRFSSQARDRRYETLLRSVSDGRVWLLEKGRDYRCGEANLRGHVRTYALQANLQFGFKTIRRNGRIIGVEVAFTPPHRPLPSGITARTLAAAVEHSQKRADA